MRPPFRAPSGAPTRDRLSYFRPSTRFVIIEVLLLIVQLSGAGAVLALHEDRRPAPAAEAPFVYRLNPVIPPRPVPTASPTRRPAVHKPAPVVTHVPVAKPKPKPKPRVDPLASLRGLGTWVDLYDYGQPANKPVTTLVAQAAVHGVSTIWVETSRYNTATIAYPAALGQLIDAAAARNIRVVAWVLPQFSNVRADLAYAKAAAAFRSPGGHRFSALGLDIEVSSGAKPPQRSARLVALARAVHGHVGMPVVSIVPPPIGFSRHPEYWPGFPWRDVAANADAIATMGYWSFSHDAPPDEYTAAALTETRRLVGRSTYPIHVIGGLAADTTVDGAAAFCRAARSGHALGASLYDLNSTPAALWSPLQGCRSVGR